MKRIISLSTLLLVMLCGICSFAQDKDAKKPPLSPAAVAQNDFATINYSQPSMRGRKIFGALVPYGQVWRTGANAATTLTLNSDVAFGGKTLKAGKYAIFTIPNENEWTIIINGNPDQFGAFKYEENKSKNVLEVKAKVEKTTAPVEAFTISFEGNNLVFQWENTKVSVPVQKL